MKRAEVKEILACLGSERRIYRYFKDRYCFDLIEFEMERLGMQSARIATLKSGPLARYLQKPTVAQALGACGNGTVQKSHLCLMGPVERVPFSLALAAWGQGNRGWDQTSRNQCNLVLQLNFHRGHQDLYQRLVKPRDHYGPFECWSHPVCQRDRKTLAWVRMDVDFGSDEVLIEEIQSDWLREADSLLARVKRLRAVNPAGCPANLCEDIQGSYEALAAYVETGLAPYRKIWAEAALLAAIRLIRDELGISTVYYHCRETGAKMKAVWGHPPSSLYTTLPRQFGFRLTREVPEMLARHKFARRCIRAIDDPCWYRLAL